MAPRRKATEMPPAPPEERMFPHNLEAERAVLGAVMLHEDAYDAAISVIDADDFFRDAHKRIFRAMGRLVEARKPVELVTLRDELLKTGDLDEVGGPAYITSLVDGVPHSSNIEHYADIVREKSRLRATILTANAAASKAYDGGSRAMEIASDAAERLYAIGEASEDGQAVHIKDLGLPAIETLEKSHGKVGPVTGLQTGFLALDELTAGLQQGDLLLVAARTSQGKTALAMNIARAVSSQVPVLVFSLEMSRMQLFMRLLASESRVDSHRLRTGLLSDMDWSKISQAFGTLSELQMLIDDQGNVGVREVRARARQVKAKYGLGAIVIDYIQLMHGRGMFDNRTQEIGTISRGLKAVARELNVPVIALSQLSRNAEPAPGRKARRPQLSDLAESGSLENDADVVFLIYRPEPKDDDTESIAEVIVAKQRNGPTGVVKLQWSSAYVRFENIGMV